MRKVTKGVTLDSVRVKICHLRGINININQLKVKSKINEFQLNA